MNRRTKGQKATKKRGVRPKGERWQEGRRRSKRVRGGLDTRRRKNTTPAFCVEGKVEEKGRASGDSRVVIEPGL